MLESLNLKIPESLKAQVLEKAKSLHISLTQIVRLSLEEFLGKGSASKSDSFIQDTAVSDAKVPATFSSNHDEHLY